MADSRNRRLASQGHRYQIKVADFGPGWRFPGFVSTSDRIAYHNGIDDCTVLIGMLIQGMVRLSV
jgi:hypothetical protein